MRAVVWNSIRNDALDSFEIRNASGRLVALLPIGETAREVEAQQRVRDLVLAAPFLLAAVRHYLEAPDETRRVLLREAVAAATGSSA
jgi:hypothetical protein